MKKNIFLLIMLFCTSSSYTQTVERTYNAKISASTVSRMKEQAQTRSSTSTGMINVYLRLSPNADMERLASDYGIRFNVGYDNVYTALVPVSSIDRMAVDDDILYIDAGHEVHSMMDEARKYTHVDEVHQGISLPSAYKGNGVLVGIVDAGFDFTHPNFRNKDGKCRIEAVWDQNNFMSTDSEYGYGKEYRTADEVAAAKRDMELSGDTHGTHVAGIAAGSFDGPYTGVAPEADIVLVSTNKTEQGIIDGIDYLVKYAEKKNRPISINLSIGTVLGYKDGTDDFTILIDNIMKDEEGKILSIAGGNEGDRRSTLAGTFGDGHSIVKSYWEPPSYNSDNLFIQGEKGSDYLLTVTLKDTVTDNTVFEKTISSSYSQTLFFENFGTTTGTNGRLAVTVAENPANGNPHISLSMNYDKPANEAWQIALSSEKGRYMANSDYGEFSSGNAEGYSDGTNEYSIATTATGFNTIAVGAYVSKNTYMDLTGATHNPGWTLEEAYPLTGKGPTYDGRIKPDVTAPGAAVVSSFSSYAGTYYVKPEDKVYEYADPVNNKKYTWGVASGTSMATPVVTGTIALWLEADPSLTTEDIRDIIRKTSAMDKFTGSTPNGVYGYGKIDALAGIKYILEDSHIAETTAGTLSYNYDGRYLRFMTTNGMERIYIYNTAGMMIRSLDATTANIGTELTPGYVYLIKVVSANSNETFKLAL